MVKVVKEDKADQAKVVLILTTMMMTTSSTEIMIAIALNCHLSSKVLKYKIMFNLFSKRSRLFSITPSSITCITTHEEGHWLVAASDLLHILTVSLLLWTKFARQTSILVRLFSHLFIESCLTCFKSVLPVLFKNLFGLFIKVQLLIISGQLFRSDFSS